MASFASKYKNFGKKEGVADAATALGIGKVNKQGEKKAIKSYIQGKSAGTTYNTTTTNAAPSSGGSPAEGVQASSPTGGYDYFSPQGASFSAGDGLLTSIGNKFPDNQSVQSMIAGSKIDNANAMAKTGLAVQYNDSFMGSLTDYQTAVDSNRAGWAKELLPEEGRISERLIEKKEEEAPLRLRADARGAIQTQNARLFA